MNYNLNITIMQSLFYLFLFYDTIIDKRTVIQNDWLGKLPK